MCAKSVDSSHNSASCYGDSGGPLVCTTEDNEQFQVGIVSYVINYCLNSNWPGFYTYVPAYSKWIINTMSELIFQIYFKQAKFS